MVSEQIETRGQGGKEKSSRSIVLPAPPDAPQVPNVHSRYGAPSSRHVYLNADGAVLGYVDRFDTADGKTFLPLTLWRDNASGTLKWRRTSWPSPRPLYGLDRLARRPDAPVLVCEGEKAADAADHLAPSYVVVTSPNGSNASKTADWAPLRGRTITIWPDADKSGQSYADAVARSTIFVAEGFATAATIHEVSNRPVVVAYSANNLPEVVRQLRERHGATQDIVVVADNDASGVGRNKADEASAKHGCRIVMPPELGDANDYALAGHDLMAILFPAQDDWLIPADDFSAQPAPLKWLVKRWIQREGLVMIHGPSGSGKTFMVLDMMGSVASRGAVGHWFGNKVRHGSVVYLAGEGHHGLRGRLAAWKAHNKVDALNMYVSAHGLDLNAPEGYQKAVEAIRGLPEVPTAIVVDTLHRHLQGDENSAQDAKGMLDACGALIQEFKATVVLVHHTGVSAEAQHRARGSSAWKGALDVEISVIPGDTIEIVQRKSKDAEAAPNLFAELQSVPIAGWYDEDGEQVTSAVMVEGIEPAKPTKDNPIIKHQRTFEMAWKGVGNPLDPDGRPHISRDDLLQYHLNDLGLKPASAAQNLKPSADGRIVCELLRSGDVVTSGDGWSVTGSSWKTALLLGVQGDG